MILVVDAILCLILLEGVALVLLHQRTGRGLPRRPVLSMLLPGFFLLLAMRLSMGGWPWFVICGVLFVALCTHCADLRSRMNLEGSRTG